MFSQSCFLPGSFMLLKKWLEEKHLKATNVLFQSLEQIVSNFALNILLVAKVNLGFFLESEEWVDFGGHLTWWLLCRSFGSWVSAIILIHLQREISPAPRDLSQCLTTCTEFRVLPAVLLRISLASAETVLSSSHSEGALLWDRRLNYTARSCFI